MMFACFSKLLHRLPVLLSISYKVSEEYKAVLWSQSCEIISLVHLKRPTPKLILCGLDLPPGWTLPVSVRKLGAALNNNKSTTCSQGWTDELPTRPAFEHVEFHVLFRTARSQGAHPNDVAHRAVLPVSVLVNHLVNSKLLLISSWEHSDF